MALETVMRRGPRSGAYRVILDGNWRLTDLYQFPHDFGQCYAFEYCLNSELETRDKDRIDQALATYPWKGGYSYVNIYSVLQRQVPLQDRPNVESISYSSPGWLDLALHVDAAVQVAKAVAAVAGSSALVAIAYRSISKTLSQMKIDKLETKAAQIKALHEMCEQMARILGFRNLEDLHRRTGNPEVTLKLLLAEYRRVERLADYLIRGKAGLPTDSSQTTVEEIRRYARMSERAEDGNS